MAKKKLLNESQVRRFMGLAGLKPPNLNEMFDKKMEEDEMSEEMYGKKMEAEKVEEYGNKMEEEELEEALYEEEPAMGEDEAEAEEPAAAEDEVSVTKDTIDAAGDAIMDLLGQLGYEAGAAPAEPEMDAMEPEMDAEEPAMDDEEEEAEEDAEEVMEEAFDGVNLELTEDEIVQEVARRVAKRILKAKKAKSQLDEALGNKSKFAKAANSTKK